MNIQRNHSWHELAALQIGVVGRISLTSNGRIIIMAVAAKPVALPEVFVGDVKQSWGDWVDHFESVADVNEWDAANKKKLIWARLTGRAATAFK